MKRMLLLMGLMVAVLTLVSSAAADQSYTDPTGDGKVGTDITGITVRNDAAGTIQFQVASANPIVANHAIAIFIDADRNPATGDSDGDEYWMYGGPAVGTGFFAWNGSDFVAVSPASFQVGAAAANVTEFRINKADIGNVSSFAFAAISISIDPPNINFWDIAPDTGSYIYTLTTAAPPPPTTTPAPPPPPPTVTLGVAVARAPGIHAGKAFAIADRVRTTVTSVRVTCKARIGTRVVRVTGRYAAGTAVCTGLVPAATAGKRLTVTITASISGARQAKTFSFLIRA
jgi:hypothetical protein